MQVQDRRELARENSRGGIVNPILRSMRLDALELVIDRPDQAHEPEHIVERDFFDDIARANRALQDNLRRGEPRIIAGYGLIGAIVLLGIGGYIVDRRLASAPWGLVTGLVLGIAIGFYDLLNTLRRT